MSQTVPTATAPQTDAHAQVATSTAEGHSPRPWPLARGSATHSFNNAPVRLAGARPPDNRRVHLSEDPVQEKAPAMILLADARPLYALPAFRQVVQNYKAHPLWPRHGCRVRHLQNVLESGMGERSWSLRNCSKPAKFSRKTGGCCLSQGLWGIAHFHFAVLRATQKRVLYRKQDLSPRGQIKSRKGHPN